MNRRRFAVLAASALALVYASALLLRAPLLDWIEARMNARLHGYRVRIGDVHLHPLGFGIDFRDIVLTQEAHPQPPVLRVPRLVASVQWSALLRARLVADFAIDAPEAHVDRTHLVRELRDPTPLRRHGWQQAVSAMYPLKINQVTIRGGSLIYREGDRAPPLELSGIDAVARNIRNVQTRGDTYPSSLALVATVFRDGRMLLDGNADFLRSPHAAVRGRIALDNVPLASLQPIADRYGLVLSAGVFDGTGRIEYAPRIRRIELETVRVRGLRADYTYERRTALRTRQAAAAAVRAARRLADRHPVQFLARRILIDDSTLGFVNEQSTPRYRIALASSSLLVEDLATRDRKRPARIHCAGTLMGSGSVTAEATFRPQRNGPDFDLDLRLEGVDLEALNDLLLAHAKIDVSSGFLSVYSELRVKDGEIDGYVKPLFQDVEIYDPDQDRSKSLGRKIRERTAEVIGNVLRNRSSEEVATVVPIQGPVKDPQAGTLSTVLGLLQNAYVKAILPGFEPGRNHSQRRDGVSSTNEPRAGE